MNPTTLADPQEGGILLDAKDGLITWRVDNFAKLRQDAVNDSKPCICSPPFFTGQTGYKMRIRLFPNGDGDAKGKSISAFTQLMKGAFDDLLPWPFVGKVILIFLHLTTAVKTLEIAINGSIRKECIYSTGVHDDS